MWVLSCLLVVPIYLCVLLHEAAHWATARAFRANVPTVVVGVGPTLARWRAGGTRWHLKLVPYGGHTAIDNTTVTPYQMVWVALAGPVSNFLAAAAALCAIRIRQSPEGWLTAPLRAVPDTVGLVHSLAASTAAPTGTPASTAGVGGVVGFILVALVIVNLGLTLQNLLPIYPMDGYIIVTATARSGTNKPGTDYAPSPAVARASYLALTTIFVVAVFVVIAF